MFRYHADEDDEKSVVVSCYFVGVFFSFYCLLLKKKILAMMSSAQYLKFNLFCFHLFSHNVPFPFGTEEVTLDIDHGAGHESLLQRTLKFLF
jgi:hypothetical protein